MASGRHCLHNFLLSKGATVSVTACIKDKVLADHKKTLSYQHTVSLSWLTTQSDS